MHVTTVIRSIACKLGIFFAATFFAVAIFTITKGFANDNAKTVITIALLLGSIILIKKPIAYGWLRHRAFYLGVLFALPALWLEPEKTVKQQSLRDTEIIQAQTDKGNNKKLADSSQKEKALVQPNPDIAYDEFSLPPEYAQYMTLFRAGAAKVFEKASCDRIEYATVSATKGTKQNPIFYYSCRKNAMYTNIFVSLKELQGSDFSLPVAIDVGIAKERCEQYIKEQLSIPSTFDSGWLDWSTREWPDGNREILIEFIAKNAFNLELPSTAKCLFIPTAKGGYEMEGNIFNR